MACVLCTVLYCAVLYHPTITAVCHSSVALSRKLCDQNTSSWRWLTGASQDQTRGRYRIRIDTSYLHIHWDPCDSSHTSLHVSYCKPPQQSPKNYKWGGTWVCQRCERLRHEMYICSWHELCVTTVTLLLTCWRWVILVQIHSSHNINIFNIAPINEAVNADSSVRSRGGERQERQTHVQNLMPDNIVYIYYLHFILSPSAIRRPSWR